MRASKHLIVVGGGAAGFFCAVNAARLNTRLRITLLEKTGKLLSKVRVSGGGRCNVTHACFDIDSMSARYPRGKNFVRKSFHHFFTTDTISWFRERGVSLKEEADGRMFPVTDDSRTIIDCLLAEAARYRVEVRMHAEVKSIRKENDQFHLSLATNETLQADFVCLAAGGYPKSPMFDWIAATGHSIEAPAPSLFTFNLPGNRVTELMGLSVADTLVAIEQSKWTERGPLLITHWGLSGPAVLRLSAWAAKELSVTGYEFTARVNWVIPVAKNEQELKQQFSHLRIHSGDKILYNHPVAELPKRLWQWLAANAGITVQMRFADLPAKIENQFIRQLVDTRFEVRGKTTFKEEFVTAGGVRLSEIDPSTMQSRKLAGLYFAGEVMDVDGITGGYNFQHAWTSGFLAATSISRQAEV